MSRAKVTVQVNADVLSGLVNRFAGIEATLQCAAAAAEGGDDAAARQAPESIRFVAGEIDRLYTDLGIESWLEQEGQL